MNAFSHPLVHLSLKIAVGVACTVATGIAFSYGLQYIIRDHNTLALRRELRARKRKLLDVLKTIESECGGTAHAQIEAAKIALERSRSTEGVAAVAAAAEAQDVGAGGAFSTPTSSPRKPALSRSRSSSNSSEKVNGTSSARTSPKIYPLPLPVLSIPLNGVAPPSENNATVSTPMFQTPTSFSPSLPSAAAATIAVDRHLREADDTLLRILEKLDAVRPAEIQEHPTGGAAASMDADADIRRIGESAVELVRARKRMLVKRAQKMLNEVDRLCGLAGLPALGGQHTV
ncbi:hypothetical protein BDZ88DRAFT_237605 [Geranomyces variabilis]|nr:hypothetical protein BDZ88DRAFT_237605 [Geranomyces variabilis]KAJ3143733.1 hypothetical protein HDU90_000498 [Geranomyces variabilis]